MKTSFYFLCAAFAFFVFAVFSALPAHAQTTTLLASQGFTTNALPSGWSANWGTDNQPSGYWFWSSTGNGGSNGSAMDDIWDYDYTPLSTPPLDASLYAHNSDSVWVDFDFFWEYNDYCLYNTLDNINIDANSDVLVSGTEATLYTYYNTSDLNYDVAQASSSYWRHYHLLIPVKDRTTSMKVSYVFLSGQGISDIAIDNVTITGYYVAPSELSLTPNPKTLNFGTATPNSPDTLYATLKSVGLAPLHVTGLNVTGSSAYSIVSGAKVGDVIPVGSSEQVGIQFLPFTSGALTGTLSVTTDGADSGSQQMALTGVGAVPGVSYNGITSLFRGVDVRLGRSAGPQYVYLTSNGVGPLTVRNVYFIGLQSNNYSVSHLPSGAIAPGQTDSIGVMFSPSIEGLPDARMVIQTTAANIPWDTVQMYGVGILPHLSDAPVNPSEQVSNQNHLLVVTFDSVAVGADTCMSVTLSNPGSDTLAITQNYLSSKDFDFTYTPLTGTDTLIPPGGSQNIQVCFSPLQAGYRTATVALQTNIPNTFGGSQQDTSKFFIQFIGTGVASPGRLVVTGTQNYDTVSIGDTECFVDTIWNLGGESITINSVVAGTQAPAPPLVFWASEYPSVPFVLAPHSYQTVLVCAEPIEAGPKGGLFWATAVGGGVDSQQYAPLELTIAIVHGKDNKSIGDSAFVETPFPSDICVGDTGTATVIVHNTGTLTDTYTASITGVHSSDFSVTSPNPSPAVIGGGSNSFVVQFVPTAGGSESITLNITRASDGQVLAVNLSSIGGSAHVTGSGTAPDAYPGSGMETFNDTITNSGTCPWTPGVPFVPENSPFAYVSGGTTPIAPGATALLSFTFTAPATPGNYSAPVTFPNAQGLSIPGAIDEVYGAVSFAGVSSVTASNGFVLGQSYPNPMQGTSEVEITVPTSTNVQLAIVDMKGNIVQTVLDRRFDAGTYSVELDASQLANGSYYYQMTAGGVTLSREMVILK